MGLDLLASTSCPCWRRAIAAVSPPMPPPATSTRRAFAVDPIAGEKYQDQRLAILLPEVRDDEQASFRSPSFL